MKWIAGSLNNTKLYSYIRSMEKGGFIKDHYIHSLGANILNKSKG